MTYQVGEKGPESFRPYAAGFLMQVSDEIIVDGGFGTAEEIEAAAARIEQRQADSRRAWLALPWYRRAYLTLVRHVRTRA